MEIKISNKYGSNGVPDNNQLRSDNKMSTLW